MELILLIIKLILFFNIILSSFNTLTQKSEFRRGKRVEVGNAPLNYKLNPVLF